jgi:hypothetical protein
VDNENYRKESSYQSSPSPDLCESSGLQWMKTKSMLIIKHTRLLLPKEGGKKRQQRLLPLNKKTSLTVFYTKATKKQIELIYLILFPQGIAFF